MDLVQDLVRVIHRLELQHNFDEALLLQNLQICLKDGEKLILFFLYSK